MIELTRLNHESFIVNIDLIVLIEANPDTVLSLTTGERLRIVEAPAEVISKVVEFKRRILAGPRA